MCSNRKKTTFITNKGFYNYETLRMEQALETLVAATIKFHRAFDAWCESPEVEDWVRVQLVNGVIVGMEDNFDSAFARKAKHKNLWCGGGENVN